MRALASSTPELAADRFATTRWSVVAAAGRSSDAAAREALECLCREYWYPIYSHVRRHGHDRSAAQDLTQAFFARLLEKDVIVRADRERGRFRSFLLGSLRNFLCNEYDRQTARKRGGGRSILSINFEVAEGRYHTEPSHELTPDRAFERQWAVTVLEQALAAVERQYRDSERQALFDALAPFLAGGGEAPDYGETAARLEMSEAAVKMAASRLRKKYRECIRHEIARTVADPADVDEELQSLFAALST